MCGGGIGDGGVVERITTSFYLGETLTSKEETRFGLIAAPHMIVVSELSEDVIAEALRSLHEQGKLQRSTLPLEIDEDD